jgi:hypothetical protein
LVIHRNDFGIAAEWHFFATKHGRIPCNTVGGTTKWKAVRLSFQCPYDKLMLTHKVLYHTWGSNPKPNGTVSQSKVGWLTQYCNTASLGKIVKTQNWEASILSSTS